MKTTKITEKGRVFHAENCVKKLRKVFISKFGNKISLVGRHAFEWEVKVIKVTSPVFMNVMTFEDREKAVEYYNRICKVY